MSRSRTIPLFATASLLPAFCLLAGAFLGGGWPVAALVSMTVLVIVMDRFGPGFEAHAALAGGLPWAVGAVHLVVLPATVWALGAGLLDPGQKLSLGVAMGLYAGQVSNACAHELIHRSDRASRWLGTAVYCSLLNGQHVSAHLLVHHVHAGTARDPSSAPVGRGFYRFALRAARAEFVEGWRAETQRQSSPRRRLHPYAIYLSGAALSLCIATLIGGWIGFLSLIAIALHAQMQLLLSDYVQHYGLRRRIDANGKPEPMGPAHSWNAPQAYSAALMMNAPRHSDHHMRPARRFVDLQLDPGGMPVLPRSMPVMAALALIPPLWRHVMDPQVAAWANAGPGVKPQPDTAPRFSPTPSDEVA
jgi:alkane 1-monooxygenase